MLNIAIEQRAAIDPIIQGLAGRLRTITATNDELIYAVNEVLKGVLKPSATWTCGNATRYLSVLRRADREAQDEIVAYERDRKPLSGPTTVDVVVKPGGEVFNFRPSDRESQAAVVEGSGHCGCCCKYTLKDGDKVESFKALEARQRLQYLTPYYEPPWYARPLGEPHPVVVDSPIREVAQAIINQVNEDKNDSNAHAD